MTDEAGFLAAVAADPTDDLARLAYADWLDEHGRADEAEFLRLEHRLRTGKTRFDALLDRLDADWLLRTGVCTRPVLVSYPPYQKIMAIKLVREYAGCGLAEAKRLAESLPARLPGPLLTPPEAARWRRAFADIGAEVRFAPGVPG